MLRRIALLSIFVTLSCKSVNDQSGVKDLEAGDGLVSPESVAACKSRVSSIPEDIFNFGVLKVDQAALPATTNSVFKTPTDPKESLDILIDQFAPNCDAAAIRNRLENGLNNQPVDIYIYFAGYGGEVQANNTSSDHYILKWLNQRDPNSLIISVGWNCAAAEAAGFDFCGKRAAVINNSASSDPVFKLLSKTTGDFFSGGNEAAAAGVIKQQSAQNGGYNRSLSYAMDATIRLIDHILMASQKAKIGTIHTVGYSGGAHMSADILREDLAKDGSLPADGNKGIKWASPGVCSDGSDQCRLSGVKQFGWSLAFGLSGWSHAIQKYNELDAKGEPSAAAIKRRAQYRNGGFLVPPHADYAGKLRVVNRKMDPTGNADDQLQRGFNDILLSDYNHVSHDYSLPLLDHKVVVQALDAWLDAPAAKSVPELGIIADLAADVNFDECKDKTCNPSTQYLAHKSNRQHQFIHIFKSPSTVNVTDGIPTPGSAVSKAVSFRGTTAKPMVLHTFDQEDLRGSVEFWYRPSTNNKGKKSLFSYAKCGATPGELMPRAFIDGKTLVFENYYRDDPNAPVKKYEAKIDLAGSRIAGSFEKGKWVHFAFSWELPVRPLKPTTDPNQVDEIMENKALHDKKGGTPVFAASNPLLAFSAGLKNTQPSSFLYQKGMGKLKIFVNGKEAATADFGSANSARECLFAKDVVSKVDYFAGYPPYIPYNNYNAATETAALNAQISGQLCKAFKVPNNPVTFGCALKDAVTAEGDMDVVRIVFGEGRTEFGDVTSDGKLKAWDVGKDYSSKRRQRPN
jgi:hypothetical protein